MASPDLHAQDAATPDASQHFERGYRFAQEGRLEEAIDEFKRAYALKPHPLVLYNLGQAYAASGRAVEAVATLRRFLADTTQAEAHREQAAAMMAHQAQRVGELVVEVSPVGAELSVDGISIGKAPLQNPVELTAGPHGVLARLADYEVFSATVQVVAKQRKTLSITLHPPPGPRTAPSISKTENALRNDLLTLRAERTRRIRTQRTAALVTGGVGVSSLVASAVIFLKNQADYADWSRQSQNLATRLNTDDPPSPQELDQLLARENTLRNRDSWAVGLGVLGGVLTATSAALWLSLPQESGTGVSVGLGANPWLGYSSNF